MLIGDEVGDWLYLSYTLVSDYRSIRRTLMGGGGRGGDT